MIKINKEQNENIQKLLDIIYNEPKYHTGSFHENINLTDLIEAVDVLLLKENNRSIHFIIDRNLNNSLDLTIDLVK